MIRLTCFVITLLLSSGELYGLGMEVLMQGPGTNKTSWKKACPIIAGNFLESKTVLKPALVNKYRCSLEQKPGRITYDFPWKLVVQISDEIVFKLYYYRDREAITSLPVKASIYPYLQDPKLMKLIAYTLIDQAHYQYVIRKTDETIDSIYDKESFARDITVYNSSFDIKTSSNIVTRVAQYRSDYVVKALENPKS